MAPTFFENVESISHGGSGKNEDRLGYRSDLFWVLDGATSLATTDIDLNKLALQYFVDLWQSYLELCDSQLSLKAIVREGIQKVVSNYRKHPQFSELAIPSLTLALGLVQEGSLQLLILGDCKVFVKTSSGIQIFSDERIRSFDESAIAQKVIKKREGLSENAAAKYIQPLLANNRKSKNQEGGYWVVSESEEAVDRAITSALIPINQIEEMLFMTDGFSRIIDLFEISDSPKMLLEEVREQGLEYLYQRLRTLEKADPYNNQYPRLKTSDDATALYLRK